MSNQKRSRRWRTEKVWLRRQRRYFEARELRGLVYEAWLHQILDTEEQASMYDFMDDVVYYQDEMDKSSKIFEDLIEDDREEQDSSGWYDWY